MIKLASMEILSAEIAGSRHIRRQAAKALGVKSSFINKTAHRATFEYDPRPGYLYVRSRAISSRCNDNYDEFPASEIKEAYHTFVGKPVFVNHVNEDHRRARGVIIDAALHEDHNHDGTPDTWAEVLMEVDANSFPKLAQAILAGHVDRTSMGCFLPGTAITMADGSRKVIETIVEGDEVVTHTGHIEPVQYTMVRDYDGIVYEVHSYGQSQSMQLTEEHPVWINRDGVRQWMNASDLVIGDKVLTPTTQDIGKPGDPVFARLLGFYLAEGNFGYDRKRHGDTPTFVEWNYHVNETDYIEETQRLIETMGYKAVGPYIKNNCATIRVNSIEFAALFLTYGGKSSWGKRLDPEVMVWDPEVQAEVLSGWFDGDGCYRNNRVEVGTASEVLAYQMHALALRCGIPATPPTKQHSPSASHKRAKWVIQAVLTPAAKNKMVSNLTDEGLWRRISAIDSRHYVGPVYNFDVDGDDSYVASDVAVHNCDVKYSVCSACGNKASTPSEYCSHIPRQKGSKLVRRRAGTNRSEEVLIREICYGLGFFENSLLVEDPADPTAYAGSGLGDIGINWSGKELGNPFPNLPLSDASNNRRSYAKLMGNISEGQLTPTSTPLTDSTLRQEESDSSHLGLSQFVSSISDTSGLSESLDHIGRVISAGPKDPMSGVVTDGVVTGMTYHDTIRNRADEIDVPPTMGSDGLSRFIREAKASIPTIEDTASPRVTGVRSSTGIDLGEVSLNLSHGRNELSITAGHDNESTVQREASADHLVDSNDIPREGPTAPGWDDHPADRDNFVGSKWKHTQVPLHGGSLHDESRCPGGVHSAECYRDTPENARGHDVAEDEYEGQNFDYNYVKKMAKDADKLPSLVVSKEGMFGGGHRTAAWHEAGWTHAPAWVEQASSPREASVRPSEGLGAFVASVAPEPSCECCRGTGEHITGLECYRCDGSGSEHEAESGPTPCDGALGFGASDPDWKGDQVRKGLESFVASVNPPLNPGGKGHVFEPEEPGSPWCAECGHHNSVTRHKEAGLAGFVGAVPTPCQTPETMYDTTLHSNEVGIKATLPFDADLSEPQAETLDSNLHNMMEMVLAPLFPPAYNPAHKSGGLAGFVAADEHLTNPADGTKDWHHGTQNDFKHFDDERTEDNKEYDDYSDPENNPHWNSHIGTHWTSLKDTAHKFARGIAYGWDKRPKDTGKGHTFTANLGIKNPKKYGSETTMDHEAFQHAWTHHEAHDPDDIHGGHCDDMECSGLGEHKPGDAVDKAAKARYSEKGQDARWLTTHPDSQDIAEGFKKRLQAKGHDGIVYGNSVPEEGPVGHKCAITFDNHQIHNLVRRNRQGHVAGLAAFVAANSDDDDLTRKSPLEIDSRLAEHHDKLDHHHTRMDRIVDTLHSVVHDKKEYRGKRSFWKKSDDEVMNHDPSTLSSWDRPQYEKLKNQHEEHHAAAQEQRSHIDRHEDEFHRRGKWNRFFIVPDGHIHSSPQCHSLHPTTRIGWLPHLSGKTEKEAVDEHGPHLCTHCFKSAPTEWKLNPTDTKAQQKKDSGEVCTGGKMHRFVGREEGKERAAQHPKNKLVLEPGEGWHDGRGNVVGKCPTCKTTQKVKNNGSVYSHKPPKVEEPKPEEKPKQEEKPVLPEPASTPAPKAPEPAPKAPEPSTPTPTPKPTPAIPEKPLQPAPKSMNSHLTRDHKMDPQVIKTVKDTGASLDSFHDSLHQNLTTIKHRHGGLAAFAQQYTFHVDFSKDKDTLKTGEVVSGAHVVSVDAHHPEEGRLIAEQMVAATGHEPTGLTAFVSSLDKVYT